MVTRAPLKVERGLNLAQADVALPFESFDEAWYKGQTQQLFTTIEFGYTPFIPASELYVMKRYREGEGEAIGPNMMALENPEWQESVAAFQMMQGVDFEDDARVPAMSIRQQAEEMAIHISDMLERPDIENQYGGGKRKEEIETLALMEYIMGVNEGYLFDFEPDLPRVNREGGLSPETIDLMNTNDQKLNALRAMNNMLFQEGAATAGVEGHKGVETTEMVTTKLYQGFFKMFQDEFDTSLDAWRESVTVMMDVLDDAHSLRGEKLEDVYDRIGTPSEKNPLTRELINLYGRDHSLTQLAATVSATFPRTQQNRQTNWAGGPSIDSLGYMARQIVSRFDDVFRYSQLGGGFTITAPLTPFEAGVATITPIFEHGPVSGVGGNRPMLDSISGWDIQAAIIGGEEYKQALEELGGPPGDPMAGTEFSWGAWAGFAAFGSKRKHFAGMTQMLAVFAWRNGLLTEEQVQIALNYAALGSMNEEATNRGRGMMIGDAIRTEMLTSFGNLIGGMTSVSAVELLSTQEASKAIKNQMEDFWKDPTIKNELTGFYKKAMKGSGDVTRAWRNAFNISGRRYDPYPSAVFNTIGLGPQPFAVGDTAPYKTNQFMQGIGVPFWMTFGREGGAFNRFKTDYSKDWNVDRWMSKGFTNPDFQTIIQRRNSSKSGFRQKKEQRVATAFRQFQRL